MILVTVGTEKFPLNRLMNWIDQLIAQNLLQPEQEEIIIQYGSCTIVPNKVKGYSVLDACEFERLVDKARLIIAHCGEGTIDLLANLTKPFILVPRTSKFQEHVDDHQLELAEQLAQQGIPIANSPKDLAEFLASPQAAKINISPAQYYEQASFLLEEEFETSAVLEDLTKELIGDFVPAFA
ncbi:glycosyltransferase [Myxosarcina sp. GI1]|uniref:glycosyltransferase n=1 Tax=Myxosarcina sp. GI1 TaxID=1541065 RepID=UPI00068D8E64|nr:glycosyltransferase [Myxosarcina sp. GI1]